MCFVGKQDLFFYLQTGLVRYMILKLHGNETRSSCDQRLFFSRLIHSPSRTASVITWKVSVRDPGITLLGSQLTGLVNKGAEISCIRALSSAATFLRPPPCPHRFFKAFRTHTQISAPPHPSQRFHTLLLYIEMYFPLSTFSPIQKLSKITKKQSESVATFKISTSMFSTIVQIFHNHHFISTDCTYTIPSKPD